MIYINIFDDLGVTDRWTDSS